MPQSTSQQLAIYALSGAVAAGLALPAAFQTHPRGVIGRLLSSSVLSWLGLISYGLYLYHVPIMLKLNAELRLPGHPGLRTLLLTTATFVLATLAATASYYIVERPALRRGLKGAIAPSGSTGHQSPAFSVWNSIR